MSLRYLQVAFNPSHMIPGVEPSADPGKTMVTAAALISRSYSLLLCFTFLSTQFFRLVCSYTI
jgi:hypothetical protein